VYDTLSADQTSAPFFYRPGQHYFVSDMCLPSANAWMAALAQRMHDGAGATRLASVLLGGALSYLSDLPDSSLPYGVADWTLSHHVWIRPPRSVRRRGAGAAAAATASASDTEHDAAAPFPLFFHCESHRAGVVNWRMDDARPEADLAAKTLDAAHAAAPAFWLCVVPEAENLARFQQAMERLSSGPYSMDQLHTVPLRSVEPLLRAGVCITLLEQHERQLVVLAPGTPHCVFTPPGATKVSRNWMTPSALLLAASRALRGAAGERADWFRHLRDHPLHCVLPMLRRLHVAEPEHFSRLIAQPSTRTQMHFLLGRAQLSGDDELQTMTLQVAAWMQHDALHAPAAPAAASPVYAGPTSMELDDETGGAASSAANAATAAPAAAAGGSAAAMARPAAGAGAAAAVSSTKAAGARDASLLQAAAAWSPPHDVKCGVVTAFAARCHEYRQSLLARLRRECPLGPALHVVEGLLLSSLPPATAHELCSELDAHDADAATMSEATHAVHAAQRERHGREAKRKNQIAKEPEIIAGLQAELERAGAKPPDMWSKLYRMKELLEHAIPADQRTPLALGRRIMRPLLPFSEPSRVYLLFCLVFSALL